MIRYFFVGLLRGVSVTCFPMERMHDDDPGQHRATMLGDQRQRLYRRAPFQCIVVALRQARDVVGGIAQGAQLAAIG